MVEEALRVLQVAHIELDDPLTAEELTRVETRFGFTFAPDHAALLRACLPTGEWWPDWRNATGASLQQKLDAPVQGILFDVSANSFWPASWGERPKDATEAADIARSRLRQWPQMVPLYAHRFIAAGPGGRRVFSIHQSDVIYYGDDILHYLRREFYRRGETPISPDPDPIWPWSNLAHGAEDSDL